MKKEELRQRKENHSPRPAQALWKIYPRGNGKVMVARRWPNHFPFSAGIFLQAWAGRKEEVEHGKTIGRPPTFISFLKRKKKCWGDHEFLLCAHLVSFPGLCRKTCMGNEVENKDVGKSIYFSEGIFHYPFANKILNYEKWMSRGGHAKRISNLWR